MRKGPSMEVGSLSTPSDLSDVYEDSRSEPYSEREMAERRQSQPSTRISHLVSEINSEINFPPLEEFIGSQLSKLRFVEEKPMEPMEETDLFPNTPLTEAELSRTDKIPVEDNIREDVTSKELIDAIIDFDNKKVSNLLNRMDVSALNEWRERMPLQPPTTCGEKNNGALALLLAKAGIDVNAKDTINEYTPLHKACWNDNDQAVSKLLAIPGIDINVENKAGYTPLHLACYRNSDRATARLLDVPGILLNVQAKYKTGDAYETGATPLHLACWRDNNEAIARLLDVPSIDVNAKDKAGTTPLHIACLSNKYKAVIRLLSTPGIDVNVKADDDGSTPFMKAAGFDKAFMLLLHDDRVHLDVKNKAGRGLEEMVNRSGRRVVDRYYLDLIREERLKRENACKTKDDESTHIIIEKIKKINQKSRDNEAKWTKVLEKQELERKKLARKHQEEKMKKEWEREKHQEEKTRQKLEREKLEKKHEEEKTKQEKAFEGEAEGFKQNMNNLTKVKNDLAQNLEKIHFN